MRLFSALLVNLSVWIFCALPFLPIGYGIAKELGVLLAALFVGIFFFLIALTSDQSLISLIKHKVYKDRSAQEFMDRVTIRIDRQDGFQSSVIRAPDIQVIDSAIPHLILGRSLGSYGTILISRGLLLQLSESQLERLFVRSYRRLNEAPLVSLTLFSICLEFLYRLAPKGWVELVSEGERSRSMVPLGVWESLKFSIVFPIITLFSWANRKLDRTPSNEELQSRFTGNEPHWGLRPLHLI